MKIPRHIFREYDIRGIADDDLTDDFARALGQSFAFLLRRESAATSRSALTRPVVAVARDGRLSSDRLFASLSAGLLAGGADVVTVGIGPTPLLYFAAHHLQTDGAVMITASHNPAPDNGFKIMRGKASFFGADIQALAALMESDEAVRSASVEPGELRERDIADAYIAAIREASRPSRTDVRFVVDAGNGSAGPLGIAALTALGFQPDPLYCDIDGRFPNHHPDPTVPHNLEALRRRVLETGARLGIAWDGDGDRIGAIDQNGDIVWGDRLLILFSRALLSEHPGATILGEVKCSETLYTDIAARGGKPIMWKTGHSLIKTKMKQEGALLAGEMSGHMFFADRYFGYDDAIYAAVRLLEIAASEAGGLPALLADVPRTFTTPEIRVDCPDAVKFAVVGRVLARYRPTHRVIDIDGARIDFGDGAWGLCRASNTQPALVLRFEALSEDRLAAIQREMEAAVVTAIRDSHAAATAGKDERDTPG